MRIVEYRKILQLYCIEKEETPDWYIYACSLKNLHSMFSGYILDTQSNRLQMKVMSVTKKVSPIYFLSTLYISWV